MEKEQKYKLVKDFGPYRPQNLREPLTRRAWSHMLFDNKHTDDDLFIMFDSLVTAGFFSPVQEEKERVTLIISCCSTVINKKYEQPFTLEEVHLIEQALNGDLLTREEAAGMAKETVIDFSLWWSKDEVNDGSWERDYDRFIEERSKA